ncbi:hypothetical protein [Zavarzinella formosa]|uniref:hypothetical protein n=1 Tax=Zavarzinella formosa TaxID=360055 RepID=UPI00031D4105|nr:hypothetical protein [Zavarzinella formosa]
MNKAYVLMTAAALAMLGVTGWFASQLILAKPSSVPTTPVSTDVRSEYDLWAASLKVDEKEIRAELNDLIAGAKIKLDEPDSARVGKLTFTCDDANTLLAIGHVANFVKTAANGKARAYAFVTAEERAILEVYAGENPSATSVLRLRKSLAELAAEFEVLRQKPDWSVEVTGEEKVAMPMLDMLREGYEFMPFSKHPALRKNPLIPAFASADAELLAQLKVYFNGARAKAAFPVAKFSNAYVKGELPAIPVGLDPYRKTAQTAIDGEKKMLLPGDKEPPAEAVEAVDDVYRKLERFLDVVGKFGK